MHTTHSERDADHFEEPIRVSRLTTDDNRFEINCSICNQVYYTDVESIAQMNRTVELGLDNPFVCEECAENYEVMSHQR